MRGRGGGVRAGREKGGGVLSSSLRKLDPINCPQAWPHWVDHVSPSTAILVAGRSTVDVHALVVRRREAEEVTAYLVSMDASRW